MKQIELQNLEFWSHRRSKLWEGAPTPPILSFNCQPAVTRLAKLLAAFLEDTGIVSPWKLMNELLKGSCSWWVWPRVTLTLGIPSPSCSLHAFICPSRLILVRTFCCLCYLVCGLCSLLTLSSIILCNKKEGNLKQCFNYLQRSFNKNQFLMIWHV